MGSKEKKIMSVKIILCVVLFVIVIVSLFILMDKGDIKDNSPVNHKVVEKLYENHGDNKCTEVIKINNNLGISEIDDKVLLYLIFGQMKNDSVLSDSISLEDYKSSALKVIDEEYIPLNFKYVFEGYQYSLNDNEITRENSSCTKNYVTKLYGYSGTDKLELDVMAGYVENGKVYDLNDNEIGTYNENELNNILDKGTMQVYNYEKVNDDYKLVSVGVK